MRKMVRDIVTGRYIKDKGVFRVFKDYTGIVCSIYTVKTCLGTAYSAR